MDANIRSFVINSDLLGKKLLQQQNLLERILPFRYRSISSSARGIGGVVLNKQEQKAIREKAEAFLTQVMAQQASQLRELNQRRISADEYFEKMPELVEQLCEQSRRFADQCHRLKFMFDWGVPPQPEWMDHFIDQFVQLREGKTLWTERGVYGVAGLKRAGNFLELCSGDGFNTFHYYRPFAKKIIAVDFDPTALAHARRYNSAANIEFREHDIRGAFPEGQFDNILWDAAIEHFTEEEIAAIMANIKKALTPEGILSGYTLIEHPDGKSLHHHEREFYSMQDLASFLEPYFPEIRIFETIHPERHNLYFYASESVLPFDDNWQHGLRISSSEPRA